MTYNRTYCKRVTSTAEMSLLYTAYAIFAETQAIMHAPYNNNAHGSTYMTVLSASAADDMQAISKLFARESTS